MRDSAIMNRGCRGSLNPRMYGWDAAFDKPAEGKAKFSVLNIPGTMLMLDKNNPASQAKPHLESLISGTDFQFSHSDADHKMVEEQVQIRVDASGLLRIRRKSNAE